MTKKLIGKRVRVQIGGTPPQDDNEDTIIGEDTTVHVPNDELHKYGKIIGEEVTLTVGNIDEPIQKILQVMQNSNETEKEKIIELSKEIINESNKNVKLEKAKSLISIASGITSISMFIIDLKSKLGL